MFDTLAIARQLAAAGIKPEQADAIAEAVKRAAEHDASGIDTNSLATKADLAELRTELAAVETRLTWRLVGAMAAIGAILRFLG
jgi:2-phosphoglycerate kinase